MYSYVTIGELLAFITGWNLILEYLIGLAVNSVALSNGIDAVTGETISQFLANNTFPVIGKFCTATHTKSDEECGPTFFLGAMFRALNRHSHFNFNLQDHIPSICLISIP
jgi:amino acid transporter